MRDLKGEEKEEGMTKHNFTPVLVASSARRKSLVRKWGVVNKTLENWCDSPPSEVPRPPRVLLPKRCLKSHHLFHSPKGKITLNLHSISGFYYFQSPSIFSFQYYTHPPIRYSSASFLSLFFLFIIKHGEHLCVVRMLLGIAFLCCFYSSKVIGYHHEMNGSIN